MANFRNCMSNKKKIRIASKFIIHVPPREFKEVLRDIWLLLRARVAQAIAQYNMDHFIPVKIQAYED